MFSLSATWKRLRSAWKKPVIPSKTKSVMWEDITPWEEHCMTKVAWMRCPDCEKGTLCEVAEGGCSVNVACDTEPCGGAFNITLLEDRIIGERIPHFRSHQH